MSEHLSISLGVVNNDVGEVLLVKRAKQERLEDGSSLSWAFPGGKVEPSESSDQTVIQEIREETGYEVAINVTIFSGLHPNAPVKVTYFGCSVVPESEQQAVNDPAIKTSLWVAVSSLSQYITSTLHPEVKKYFQ